MVVAVVAAAVVAAAALVLDIAPFFAAPLVAALPYVAVAVAVGNIGCTWRQ